MDQAPIITIIIPLHNRILFLPQALEYYSLAKNKISLKVIVADSSSEENFAKNAEVINSYPDLNIQHVAVREGGKTLYEKIISVIKYVDTDFCVCSADDDIVTISGLKEGCEFLKNNPDYVVAHGVYVSFHVRPNGNKIDLYWRPTYFNHSIEDDTPEARLTDQFLHTKHTLYAIHRTKELQYIYQQVRDTLNTNTKILLFGEFLSTMLASIRGKIKDLPVFFSARREDASYQGQHIKWPLIREYVENGKLDEEGIEFKNCVAKNLISNSKSGLGVERAQFLINDGLRQSLEKGITPDRFRHLVLHTANFLKSSHAPGWFYKLSSNVYRHFVPVKRGGNSGNFLDTDLASYNDDFTSFKEIVLKHTQTQLK